MLILLYEILLARALGVHPGYDDRNFFTYELQRVHNFWREAIPAPEEFHMLLDPSRLGVEKKSVAVRKTSFTSIQG